MYLNLFKILFLNPSTHRIQLKLFKFNGDTEKVVVAKLAEELYIIIIAINFQMNSMLGIQC